MCEVFEAWRGLWVASAFFILAFTFVGGMALGRVLALSR